MKLTFVPNWKTLWRAYSVQADAIPLAIIGAWSVLPEDWKDLIPVSWMLWVAVTAFALGIVGRVIEQPKLHEDKP